jgi:hypothetical protein
MTELERAERDVTTYGESFRVEAAITEAMTGTTYASRREAFDDWYTDQLLMEEWRVTYDDDDAEMLDRIREWLRGCKLGDDQIRELMPNIMLPSEIPLVKLLRLNGAWHRLETLRAQGAGEAVTQ